MTRRWPVVAIGEVLSKSDDWIEVVPEASYRLLTVRLWGRGVILRREVVGAQIAAAKMRLVRANQFILSRIDARNGALGLVPKELDNSVASSDFPTFWINTKRVLPEFLAWMSKSTTMVELCRRASEGTTNRVRLQEDRFFEGRIALPDLADQLRIVLRIGEIAARIGEADRLRRERVRQLARLVMTMAHRPDLDFETKVSRGWRPERLGDLVTQVKDICRVDVSTSYSNVGMLSFGRGLFAKPPIDGVSTSAKELNRIRSGQFIYSRLFAFEGAYGVVPERFEGHYVSAEFPTFECDRRKVIPAFLSAYFRHPDVWAQVAAGSKGLGDRRQRVQPEQLLSHRLLMPPMEWQETTRLVCEWVEAAERLNAESTASVEALMPAVLDRAFKGEL